MTKRRFVDETRVTEDFVCKTCNAVFSLQTTLNTHVKNYHTYAQTWTCKTCQREFTLEGNLKRHINQVHLKLSRFFDCQKCGENFDYERDFKVHQKEFHPEPTKIFQCSFEGCGKILSSQKSVNRHIRTQHVVSRPVFACDMCDAKLNSKQNLTEHKKLSHSIESKFECQLCERKCKSKSILNMHIKQVHNDPTYECDECDKKFHTNTRLKEHLTIHSNTRPFQCFYCETYFKLPNILRKHELNVHSAEKKYSCDHCSYKSNYNFVVKTHMQRHEDQKTYIFGCTMQDGGTQVCSNNDIPCTIRCKTKYHLDMHIERNHTEEGIASKFETETKLAKYFDMKGILRLGK